jgi:hypothetical protein
MKGVSEKEWRKVRKKVHAGRTTAETKKSTDRILRLRIEVKDWDLDYIGVDENGNLFIRARFKSEAPRDYSWGEIPVTLDAGQFRRLYRHIEDLTRPMETCRRRN